MRVHGLESFLKTAEGSLSRSLPFGVLVTESSDGFVALGMEAPELFLEVAGFPRPADEVIVRLSLNFERSPLSGKVGVLFRGCLRSAQGN